MELLGIQPLEANPDVEAYYAEMPALRRVVPRSRIIRRVAQQPLQDDSVSSSTPAILDHELYGPALMQRLDGYFIIFHSTTHIIEHVAANIQRYTSYTPADMKGKSIDHFIHPSNISDLTTAQEMLMQSDGRDKQRLLIRMVIGREQYEFVEMVLDLGRHDGEESVICSVERMGSDIMSRDPTIQEFATKIKLDGTISSIENSGVCDFYCDHLNEDLIGMKLQEFFYGAEKEWYEKMISSIVVQQRAEVPDARWIDDDFTCRLTTVAKFFRCRSTWEAEDFIMCVHTITSR